MKLSEIRNKVYAELDSRNLKSPRIRKKALDHILEYIKVSEYYNGADVILPDDKERIKKGYESYKGVILNSAEKSVINEMYNQYER